MQPDVTIIIPTFNRLWSLPRAIASCRQSGLSLEIIVVDDGSTDGTWEWLQQQDGLVSLRQENLGKCWAANRAFSLAKGKYVRFLDSDDWYHDNVLQQQFLLAEKEAADVVTGGFSLWRDEGRQLASKNWTHCSDFIAQQLGECDSSHYSAYLFLREFVTDIPHRPDFAARDDRLFMLEVALRHPKVATFDPPVIALRHHDRPRLQFPTGMRAVVTNYQHLQIYRRILGRLDSLGELSLRRKKAAIKVLWPLAHWVAYQDLDEARRIADWIKSLDPGFSPPEPGLLGFLYKKAGFLATEKLLRLRRRLLAFNTRLKAVG